MDSTPPRPTAGGSASRGPTAGGFASQGHTAGEFASQGQSGGESAARGRLLLIEDDPESAFFCTYVLSKRGGFDVTHVADPTVALTLAVTRPWGLVLPHLDLPIMLGTHVVAPLRGGAPRPPARGPLAPRGPVPGLSAPFADPGGDRTRAGRRADQAGPGRPAALHG